MDVCFLELPMVCMTILNISDLCPPYLRHILCYRAVFVVCLHHLYSCWCYCPVVAYISHVVWYPIPWIVANSSPVISTLILVALVLLVCPIFDIVAMTSLCWGLYSVCRDHKLCAYARSDTTVIWNRYGCCHAQFSEMGRLYHRGLLILHQRNHLCDLKGGVASILPTW